MIVLRDKRFALGGFIKTSMPLKNKFIFTKANDFENLAGGKTNFNILSKEGRNNLLNTPKNEILSKSAVNVVRNPGSAAIKVGVSAIGGVNPVNIGVVDAVAAGINKGASKQIENVGLGLTKKVFKDRATGLATTANKLEHTTIGYDGRTLKEAAITPTETSKSMFRAGTFGKAYSEKQNDMLILRNKNFSRHTALVEWLVDRKKNPYSGSIIKNIVSDLSNKELAKKPLKPGEAFKLGRKIVNRDKFIDKNISMPLVKTLHKSKEIGNKAISGGKDVATSLANTLDRSKQGTYNLFRNKKKILPSLKDTRGTLHDFNNIAKDEVKSTVRGLKSTVRQVVNNPVNEAAGRLVGVGVSNPLAIAGESTVSIPVPFAAEVGAVVSKSARDGLVGLTGKHSKKINKALLNGGAKSKRWVSKSLARRDGRKRMSVNQIKNELLLHHDMVLM